VGRPDTRRQRVGSAVRAVGLGWRAGEARCWAARGGSVVTMQHGGSALARRAAAAAVACAPGLRGTGASAPRAAAGAQPRRRRCANGAARDVLPPGRALGVVPRLPTAGDTAAPRAPAPRLGARLATQRDRPAAPCAAAGASPAVAALEPGPPAPPPAPPPLQPARRPARPRITRVGSTPLAGGTLHELRVGPLQLAAGDDGPLATRTDMRTVRVWLPLATSPLPLEPAELNVLVLHDGQNLFRDEEAFGGACWRVAEAANWCVSSGLCAPFAIVGVDHAGPLRSLDFLPCVPGTGVGEFRPEAAAWPGGGVDMYLDALADVILPGVQGEFNLTSDPARVALGGSSFGAMATLHALASGHRLAAHFSAALIESPSLWIQDGRYLQGVLLPRVNPLAARTKRALSEPDGIEAQLGRHAARWPQRMWLAMGMREHSGCRPESGGLGAAVDAQHACGATLLAAALGVGVGMGPERLRFMLEPGAAHHERDWARRLPHALQFLMGPMPGRRALASDEELPLPEVPAQPVQPAEPPVPLSPAEQAMEAAFAAAGRPPDPAAAMAAGTALFYFAPGLLVAGAPATVYYNRSRSNAALAAGEGLMMHFGFDGWSTAHAPAAPLVLSPAEGLPRGPRADWWCGTLAELPETALEINFVFSDRQAAVWDNAGGADYALPVVPAEEAVPRTSAPPPREVAESQEQEHAGGTLHILQLAPRAGVAAGTAKEARAARWQEEKVLRVWTPPGWSLENAPPGGYPVLYMSDSQNAYEDWLAHQGVSWRAGEALGALVEAGQLPPMIIVGIDAVGAFRCLNFLPFPPGTGAGGFRPECARWPGGGVDAYLKRLTEEILPLAERRFGASPLRARRAFCGASFGGVAALQAALTYPHVFGGVLCESPSLWVGEGRYLETLRAHAGGLPQRLFLGSGTREYSGTRDHENKEVDDLLLSYHTEAARILEEKGLRDGRLRFQVDEGGTHHESAWGWRFSGALLHLFGSL
jgi:enterochelin esterase-like enzyme